MSKTVRAKFTCDTITQTMGGRYRNVQGKQEWTPEPVFSIEMSPVYSEDEGSENKQFWEATPSGKLELQCVLKESVAHLEVGKEYYLDISPAEPAASEA